MVDHLQDLEHMKEELWNLRHQIAQSKKSEPWTMKKLNKVLSSLKTNKARDPLGLSNIIFKENICGEDFKKSLLMLYEKMKNLQEVPKFMEIVDITSIYKKKGDMNDFDNYRGIFTLVTIRSIIEKMIYNDNYENIE